MNIAAYWEWFDPPTSVPVWRLLSVSLAVLAVLAALLAHRPGRAPGGLTRGERWRGERGPAARLGLGILLTAPPLVAAILLMLVVAPLRRPVDLVLFSSLRDPGTTAPGLSPPTSRARIDLGPSVQAAFRALDGAGARRWGTGSAEEREAARRILVATAHAPRVLNRGERPIVPDRGGLPLWLARSVEISAVQRALRSVNVQRVLIAPGPEGSDESGWRLAAALLAGHRGGITLVDPPPDPPRVTTIRRLVDVRLLAGSIAKLVGWAVVEGPNPAATLALRLLGGGDSGNGAPVTEEIAAWDVADSPDAGAGEPRIVPFQIEVTASVPEGPLSLADAGGSVSAPVRRLGAGGPVPPKLRVQGTGQAEIIATLSALRNDPAAADLRDELSAYGTPAPEPVMTDPADVILDSRPGAIVIADVPARADRVHQARAMAHPVATASGTGSATLIGRVLTTRGEPGTVFSWQGLPAPVGTTATPGAIGLVAATPRVQAWPSLATPDAPGGSIVEQVPDGPAVAVVLLGAAAEPIDPVQRMAQLRSIAWASTQVRSASRATVDNDLDGESSSNGPPRAIAAAPLFSDPELRRDADQSAAVLDGWAVAALGLALAAGLSHLVADSLFSRRSSR